MIEIGTMRSGRKVRLAALYRNTESIHHEEMHLGSDGVLRHNYYSLISKRRHYGHTLGIKSDKSLKLFIAEMPNDL